MIRRLIPALLIAPMLIACSVTTAAGGCTYDTQCKGDRICQKGECVEPAAKAIDPTTKL